MFRVFLGTSHALSDWSLRSVPGYAFRSLNKRKHIQKRARLQPVGCGYMLTLDAGVLDAGVRCGFSSIFLASSFFLLPGRVQPVLTVRLSLTVSKHPATVHERNPLGSSLKGNTILNNEKSLQDSRQYWDNLASSFDEEPDHGLHDPVVRETWADFLRRSLPYTNATILDIGCGTGSLSVVLAELGHQVTGIDLSPSMISLARTKAATLGFQVAFHVMDAAWPQLPHKQFDAIICRHLLWALPEPKKVLQRWAELLKQKGRLLLIEGYWGTGAGLRANEIIEILPASFTGFTLQNLSENPNFWGKRVSDERYAIIVDRIP